MYAYHRLWLTLLVLAIVTTRMCGFANEHDISESGNLMSESHLGASQSAASLKELNGNSELSEDLSLELQSSIRFEPPQLDFGIWSVGTVRSQTVTLFNHNSNRSVYLSSVSCGTPAFTSSFFEASMVPPNGNTTFKVVFLPREEGAISTSLHIHTSFGKMQLMVRGEGRECPYRLKPLVGIRAPLNATLMPEIHMYNPHQEALQVLEVYSSGGHFQLELPSGDNEGPKGLWEIPPFTTKPVIRIRFQGHTPGNYSAFIRIKIAEPSFNTSDSNSKNEEQILVIPVEFEILSKYGVYAVNPLLEFGQLAVVMTDMRVFRQKLFLKHSESQLDVNELEFESLTYLSGVYFQNNTTIELIPNDMTDTVVRLNEKLELILKNKTSYTYHIDLILRADIFKGNLHYNVNKTLFLIDTPEKANNRLEEVGEDRIGNTVGSNSLGNRLLKLRNDFQIPMVIFNVTSSSSESVKLNLQLSSFEMGTILRPGHSIDLFVSTALVNEQEKDKSDQQSEQDLKDLKHYKTVIYVFTNITNFQIPIVISTARLFVTTQTQTIWHHNTSVYTKELHLGSVLLKEVSRNGFIILQNRNSIPIHLSNIGVKRPQGVYYHVFYHGCIRASDLKENSVNGVDLEKANYRITSLLEEGDVAVYEANIQSYVTEHSAAHFRISTEYENITVDIKFTTALGRLEVDQEKLHFINCFPGKLCSSELSIRSTFKHSIHIKSINFTNPGLRFEDKSRTGSKIAPQTVTAIGRIYFEPSALCGSRCYIQHNDESLVFGNLPEILNLSSDIPVFDEVELRRRIELYRHFKNYFQNIVFTLTTKEMQNFQLNLMIELEWPQLVNSRQVLPAVEVNKSMIHHVKISNPSDEPILIDYRLSNSFYAMYTKIYLPLEVVDMIPGCYLGDMPFFSLANAPPKKPILIPGLSSITIPIKFQADFACSQCTVLHIRNNLTLYEGVWISAKALQSQFRFGNRKPGSKTPLLFEITEQQLASACPIVNERIKETQTDHYVQPQVISRRVFTARNSGELPIRIDSFLIGNQPCKGYGFQVTDCDSFELKANSSRKIEISYQTDFTATRVSKPLTLKTNLTYEVNYVLVAQMPSNGFEQCSRLLPRPLWEQKIRNAAIVMLLITFFLVLIAVHIDYGNIIYNQSALYEAREKGTVHPTFNLRNIAMRTSMQTNESPSQANEFNNKAGKSKTLTVEKFDSTSSNTMMNLKRRNVKNSSKTPNGEAKSASMGGRKTISLADMVSWTFGSKNSRKTSVNSNKNIKAADDQTNGNAVVQPTGNEMKTTKSRLTEKSLIDKMDNDLKKLQTYRKTKTNDKIMNKTVEKIEEDIKKKSEENTDKEIKKDKSSPKLHSKPNISANNFVDGSISSVKGTKELQRKSLALTSQDSYFDNSAATESDKNQNSPKETTANGRKIGKTPGRERRKQSAQSSSPTTSDATSSSCSSSTSSTCSSNHNTTAKRHERKAKVKASNSLKFNSNINNVNSMFPLASSSSSSPTSITLTGLKTESTKSHVDILSPWDCSTNQVSFSDVLQKPQPQLYAKAKQQENISSNNDLMQQNSLFSDLLSNSHATGVENSEIVAALTPKRPKNPTTDLGPIGSRKSPSSTPVWEPLHSAITMQLPRPINVNPTTATTLPSSSVTSSFYPMNSNFGYNDLTTSLSAQMPSSLHQQQQDIQAQLLVLQHQLLEQQHLQQQQQQFLNSNTLNSNWSSSLWGPILGNSSTTAHANTSSIFNQTPAPNSAWSLTSPSTSTSTGGLVRPPPGLEQNFSLTTGMNSHQTLAASSSSCTPTSSTLSSTFNSSLASSANTANNDNMPMFDLFGGLSSIWNDNWKQTTNQQQQQQQQQQHQKHPSPSSPQQ